MLRDQQFSPPAQDVKRKVIKRTVRAPSSWIESCTDSLDAEFDAAFDPSLPPDSYEIKISYEAEAHKRMALKERTRRSNQRRTSRRRVISNPPVRGTPSLSVEMEMTPKKIELGYFPALFTGKPQLRRVNLQADAKNKTRPDAGTAKTADTELGRYEPAVAPKKRTMIMKQKVRAFLTSLKRRRNQWKFKLFTTVILSVWCYLMYLAMTLRMGHMVPLHQEIPIPTTIVQPIHDSAEHALTMYTEPEKASTPEVPTAVPVGSDTTSTDVKKNLPKKLPRNVQVEEPKKFHGKPSKLLSRELFHRFRKRNHRQATKA